MGSINNGGLSKLWIRMKSYINNRIEDLDVVIQDSISSSGYTKIDKLWENASPTSAFAAQTLQGGLLNTLNDYDSIGIEFNLYTGYSYISSYFTIVPAGRTSTCQTIDYTATSSSNFFGYQRNVTVGSNTIAFINGAYKNATSNSPTASSNVMIPVTIYGIKGVNNNG